MRAGDRLIGLRSNDAVLAARLRAALAAHVEPDYEAPPNLSLKLGALRGRAQDFHLLYCGGRQVLRTRSVWRLLQVALLYVDALGHGAPARLNARLLEIGGIAVLVDDWLTQALDSVERRAERLGYRVIDTAGVPVDPERGCVIVTAPTMAIDRAAWADLDEAYPPDGRDVVGPASLPLGSIVVLDRQLEDAASPAARVIALARIAVPTGRPLQESDLALAVRIHRRCAVHACAAEGAALLDVLAGLAARETPGRPAAETHPA